MKQLLSPKQVATSIGVSESSLKRWCDQGVITTERTPGGHRRIRIGEVIRFLRDREQPLIRPEVLGLPAGAGQGPRSTSQIGETLLDALREGDDEKSRRLVLDQYLAGSTLVRICNELLTPSLHSIGEGWQCGSVQIFQEHRACEILNRLIYDLRSLLPPPPPDAPVAIGGTTTGDHYRLATLMIELVLVDDGWNAMSLGTSLPFDTLLSAVENHQPSLTWLSFSYVTDPDTTAEEFFRFLENCPPDGTVVIGGQQTPDRLREAADGRRLRFCADLTELREMVRADLPVRR